MLTVLYVPFDEATDLVHAAKVWCANTQKPNDLVLVQHGQKFNLPANTPLKIYVLGHGLTPGWIKAPYNLDHHISAGIDLKSFTVMPIEQIAERFMQDFLFYMPKVAAIKLYFCNTMDTEQELATRFQQSLSLPQCQGVNIEYYKGILEPPNALDGHKYSQSAEGVKFRASKQRFHLPIPQDKDEDLEFNKNNNHKHHSNFFTKTHSSVHDLKRRGAMRDKCQMF